MSLQDIKPLLTGKPNLDLPEQDKTFKRVDDNFRAQATDITTAQTDITALQALSPGTHEIVLNSTNGYGSTGVYVRRWTNIERNIGTAMTLTQSATNGDSITINVAGIYGMYYTDNFTGAQQFGISLNGAIATMFHFLAQGNVITRTFGWANNGACCAATRWLSVGDVVRAHAQGTAADASGRDKFGIVLLSKG